LSHEVSLRFNVRFSMSDFEGVLEVVFYVILRIAGLSILRLVGFRIIFVRFIGLVGSCLISVSEFVVKEHGGDLIFLLFFIFLGKLLLCLLFHWRLPTQLINQLDSEAGGEKQRVDVGKWFELCSDPKWPRSNAALCEPVVMLLDGFLGFDVASDFNLGLEINRFEVQLVLLWNRFSFFVRVRLYCLYCLFFLIFTQKFFFVSVCFSFLIRLILVVGIYSVFSGFNLIFASLVL
jgi:hypothetical protein